MKPVSIRDQKGANAIVGLGNLENKFALSNSELKRLQPYLQHVINLSNEKKGTKVSIKDNALIITAASLKSVSSISVNGENFHVIAPSAPPDVLRIERLFNNTISKNLIVEQGMIRHRVMQFEAVNDTIIVKYITLGEVNNFSAALKELNAQHPLVGRSKL